MKRHRTTAAVRWLIGAGVVALTVVVVGRSLRGRVWSSLAATVDRLRDVAPRLSSLS